MKKNKVIILLALLSSCYSPTTSEIYSSLSDNSSVSSFSSQEIVFYKEFIINFLSNASRVWKSSCAAALPVHSRVQSSSMSAPAFFMSSPPSADFPGAAESRGPVCPASSRSASTRRPGWAGGNPVRGSRRRRS